MCIRIPLLAVLLVTSLQTLADEQFVVINAINDEGTGASIGTIKLSDSPQGLVIAPDLTLLTPGMHGFHVHENPSCDTAEKDGKKSAGHAAGGHFDPRHTGKHTGPQGSGHLGDLPLLEVNAQGESPGKLLAPHLKLADIKGHALMIHAGGDSYSDSPKPLGGGGARVACGIIEP